MIAHDLREVCLCPDYAVKAPFLLVDIVRRRALDQIAAGQWTLRERSEAGLSQSARMLRKWGHEEAFGGGWKWRLPVSEADGQGCQDDWGQGTWRPSSEHGNAAGNKGFGPALALSGACRSAQGRQDVE